MIFSTIASALFAAIFLVVVVRKFDFLLLKFGLMLFAGAGMYFVWNPGQITLLANLIGIGRGGDLIAYSTSALFFLALTAGIIRERRASDTLTLLVRKLALRDARHPAADR